jgi:hypothetical protein
MNAPKVQGHSLQIDVAIDSIYMLLDSDYTPNSANVLQGKDNEDGSNLFQVVAEVDTVGSSFF